LQNRLIKWISYQIEKVGWVEYNETQQRQNLQPFRWVSLSLNTNLRKHVISQAFYSLFRTETGETYSYDPQTTKNEGAVNSGKSWDFKLLVNCLTPSIIKN